MTRSMKSDEFASYVDSLRREAADDRMVPDDMARDAAAATMRALADECDGAVLRRRARAYFWTVVRRKVLRAPAAAEARAHFLLSAVVADLEDAGRSPQGVWEELRRGWADRVPASVLRQYRQRLCA